MPMKSLGLVVVPVPGTPVRITAVATLADRINFEPLKAAGAANTGKIYIGLSNMNKATLAGVLYVLSPGQPAATMQIVTRVALTDDVSNYWVDADTANEGVLVSYV